MSTKRRCGPKRCLKCLRKQNYPQPLSTAQYRNSHVTLLRLTPSRLCTKRTCTPKCVEKSRPLPSCLPKNAPFPPIQGDYAGAEAALREALQLDERGDEPEEEEEEEDALTAFGDLGFLPQIEVLFFLARFEEKPFRARAPGWRCEGAALQSAVYLLPTEKGRERE